MVGRMKNSTKRQIMREKRIKRKIKKCAIELQKYEPELRVHKKSINNTEIVVI